MSESMHQQTAWWENLETTGKFDGVAVPFRDYLPREQFIVGAEDSGVRFYNFGSPMQPGYQADCVQFVDLVTQTFGEQAYELLGNVVIAPFGKAAENSGEKSVGFVHYGRSGVLFADSSLLTRSPSSMSPEMPVTQFLHTLVHEFGHLMHGVDGEDPRQLLEFARAVGWNVDAMLQKFGDAWQDDPDGLSRFSPAGEAVLDPLGSRPKRMPLSLFLDENDWGERVDGWDIDDIDHYTTGSPTEYGRKSPCETMGETTAHALLGEWMLRKMPETRDAWLEYVAKRFPERAIATPINRPEVTLRRVASGALDLAQAA